MSARASTSNPPPKFTKSFIPPPDSSRSQSFASSPVRTFRDGAPPPKRRRLASTPTSSSFSLSTPRSSSIRPERPTPDNIHDARSASSMRLLNIWASLAERYNRRLDEDDIVDIRTGEIIKDRGVLSELPKRYKFGDLAAKDDAINTDPGSEPAENLAEDEEDDDDGEGDDDEDDAKEDHAFPPPDDLPSQLARLVPLRPATSSSDADDLREFLKAEAIRRELDGGDDESSEDEFNILPPRSTPAKRTINPARGKHRPQKSPIPDTESEDEFAVCEIDQDELYLRYRVLRTPSPEIPAFVPSPPPPSSSPGPSSSFSLASSPSLSRTPLDSNRGSQTEVRPGSPTPKRQPVASTSRRTIEEALDEIDLEFPPPRPRAPSVFAKRSSPASIIDLSISDDETKDERPVLPAKVTTNQKSTPSEPKTTKKAAIALNPKRQIPYVLIESKPKPTTLACVIPTPTADFDPTSPRADLDQGTSPKKGRPRTRSSKGKVPNPGGPRSTNAKSEAKPESESGGTFSSVPASPGVDKTPVAKGMSKVKSPSLSPPRSDPTPKIKARPKPRAKGKSLSTRLEPSSVGNGPPSPTRRVTSPKPSPKSFVAPRPDSNPKSARESVAKPRSTRSTRSAGSGDSAKTAKPMSKSKFPRKPQDVLLDAEGDDRDSTPLPPSPSPALPTRPRTRSALKRKRRISSDSSSNEEQRNQSPDPKPPSLLRSDAGQVRKTTTPEVTGIDPHDNDGNPEAGGSKPRIQSPPGSAATAEFTSPLTPTNTIPTVAGSNYGWRGNNTPNRPGGPYTHLPIPSPLPVGFPDQVNQSFTPYPGHPPPFQDYGRYEHGTHPIFQDPNAQAILAQAVTQLAVLMNGGRPPQTEHFGGMRGIPGNMPTTNGFPGSPGWGIFPAFPPSTPTTPRYPHGYAYQQPSFQNPYFAQHQAGPGMGLSTPPPTFPPSDSFPSSMSQPEPTPAPRENGAVQEQASNTARRRVTFASDLASSSEDGPSVPEEASWRGTEDSPLTTRSRSRAKNIVKGTPRPETNLKGKSKADKSDQGSRLDAGDSGNEGNVDRHSSLENRNRARRRRPGSGE